MKNEWKAVELNSKKDYVNLMHTILDPLKPYYSEGGARLKIGNFGTNYTQTDIELEAFSRPLWALVPFWHGGGEDQEFAEIYLNGIIHGTNPKSDEYWGDFRNSSQKFVEMAAISMGLILTPNKLWQPLTKEQKENLASWLDGINHYAIPDCNWQFFMILVNLALKKCTGTCNTTRLQSGLDKIESFYIGDGWYQDGNSCQKDYYIAFAIQYYALLYSVFMEKEDPNRCKVYRQRAEEFAKDFIHWFAEDGSAVAYGRSLTYHWAQNCFWSACIFAGIRPFSLGVMKGILNRNFKWWMQQHCFERDGILTVGYAYPNLIMSERYNGPGGPYWAMKSFLILGLSDSHEFWNVKEEPLPERAPIVVLKKADMLVQHFKNDTCILPAGVCEQYGHGHVPEKYAKFAYSTALSFSCARSSLVDHEAAADSMLAFMIDDTVLVRKYSTKWEVTMEGVYSEWSPFPGINVSTWIIPRKSGHIRKHLIQSEYDCIANDYGFSIPDLENSNCSESISTMASTVSSRKAMCQVRGITGIGKPGILKADPNTNLIYTNTKIPYFQYQIQKGMNELVTEIISEVFN